MGGKEFCAKPYTCNHKESAPVLHFYHAQTARPPLLDLTILAMSSAMLLLTSLLLARALLDYADSGGAAAVKLTPMPLRDVQINIDGQTRHLQSMLRQPLPILASAGIQLGDKDRVWINGAAASGASLPAWTIPARRIDIRRAKPCESRTTARKSR